MKKEEHTAKEALDRGAAGLTPEPSRWEEGKTGSSAGWRFQGTTATAPRTAWKKSDQLQTPIARIQTDDARAKAIQVNSPLQERPGKGSIVDIGRREQKQQW